MSNMNMMPEFDENGNIPLINSSGIIESDIKEFQDKFVNAFQSSSTRVKIFKGYLNYCKHLVSFNVPIIQWFDGSFTSQKNDPNDIDFVTHFDGAKLDSLDKHTKNRFYSFGPTKKIKSSYMCHSFFIPIYYEINGELVDDSKNQIAYWKKHFGHDRKRNPKTIIELNFNELSSFYNVCEKYK
nr:hypothetical protein [Methanosarcina barkeri]